MDELYQCAVAFHNLLDVEYHIVIGRKGKSVIIDLAFDRKDFFHLIGLQHLKDLTNLKRDRGKIFNQIMTRQITIDQLRNSSFFNKIEKRISCFMHIENMLDNNDIIFKYSKNMNLYSRVDADYLMLHTINENIVYLFIDKLELYEKHFCRSFFPKENQDFTRNQARYTLLYKEKLNLKTQQRIVQYNRL
jgi:hypothetical protein